MLIYILCFKLQIERIHPSGEIEVRYVNGTRKVISADGSSRKFFFYNGDEKEIFPDSQEVSLRCFLQLFGRNIL